MTVSFRVGRYLLALLWHWSIPFVLGGLFASVLALQGVQEGVELLDGALDASISRVAESCSVRSPEPLPPANADAESVKGRAPGLSEHVSSFGQTEARAERTLERPPDKSASARECGAASPPRAPEPSAARVG